MDKTLKRTCLWKQHVRLNARMVNFAGWEMPVRYTSIFAESNTVRSHVGIFDVSHMGRLYISGNDATSLMDYMLTCNVSNLGYGKARYAMICNKKGGIIDDTIFYRIDQTNYLLVCNAGNHKHVVPWILDLKRARFESVQIDDQTETTSMISVQGPMSANIIDTLSANPVSTIRPFTTTNALMHYKRVFIARTGYTGEDGFELIGSAADGPMLWNNLIDSGATPCGLAARDVLRLEAGLPLHGNDIDSSTTPLESRLNRFVALDKEFVGSDSLKMQKETGINRLLVGINVEGKSIARHGSSILAGTKKVGEVTSGTLSPTLDRNIAMGYVLVDFSKPGQRLQIDIRGKLSGAEVALLPFYSRKMPK